MKTKIKSQVIVVTPKDPNTLAARLRMLFEGVDVVNSEKSDSKLLVTNEATTVNMNPEAKVFNIEDADGDISKVVDAIEGDETLIEPRGYKPREIEIVQNEDNSGFTKKVDGVETKSNDYLDTVSSANGTESGFAGVIR